MLRVVQFFLCAALVVFATGSFAQNYRPGEVIVKLKSNKQDGSSFAFLGKVQTEKQMVLKASYGKMNLHYFALGKGQSVEQTIRELSQDPEVEYVEPNYYLNKLQVDSYGSDGGYESQSNDILSTDPDLGLYESWVAMSNSGFAGPSQSPPVIAVIDTGLDTTHSAFQDTDALWVNEDEIPGNGIDDDGNGYVDDVNGWNFIINSGLMYDDDGHGTHVSGIILSVDQDITSTNPPPPQPSKVKIMPLKFLDGDGNGVTSDAIKAIYYAVNNGAMVLNNSWGGSAYSSALHDAVAYSYQKGALFVAAAGNEGDNSDYYPMYPASYNVPNVISVGATRSDNHLASFSNYGNSVHLGSPGSGIKSTYPGNSFRYMSGTSMAAPFVAGTAGQILVLQPSMLGYQMKTIILDQTRYYNQLTNFVQTSGKLDIAASLAAASGAQVQSSQPSYKVERGLASPDMAGCGMVRKMGGGGPFSGPKSIAQILITFGLLLLPLVAYQVRRMLSPQSRRRFERYKIDSEVRISVGDKELVGSVSSISLGGAQVNTSALLEDGGMITMLIESPDGSERIEVAGRVVWSEANKAYGVAFDHAPQSVLHRITDWTRGLQKT